MGFVLGGGLVRAGELVRGKWQLGTAFDLANHNVDLCNVSIELFHKVLGDQVSPSLLVAGVLEDGAHDFVVGHVEMLENLM